MQKFCILKKHEAPAKFLHGTTKDKRKEDELFLLETAAYCGLVASAEQLFKIFSSVELSLFQSVVYYPHLSLMLHIRHMLMCTSILEVFFAILNYNLIGRNSALIIYTETSKIIDILSFENFSYLKKLKILKMIYLCNYQYIYLFTGDQFCPKTLLLRCWSDQNAVLTRNGMGWD